MSDAPRWTPPSDPGAGSEAGPTPWSAPAPVPAPPVAPAPPASAPPAYVPPAYVPAPPGAAPVPPAYAPAPPAYSPAAPRYAPAPGSAPAGPGTGWTPPPKPGLVPLRPMTLGTILGAMFRVMRRNPLPTLGLSLLLSLFGGGAVAALFALAVAPLAFDGAPTTGSGVLGSVLLSFVGAIVAVLVQLLVTSVVQGIVTLEVASGTLGERMRIAGLWRRARSRLPALIAWLLLLGVAATLLIGILVLVVVAVASLGQGAAVGAVLVGVLGTLGLIVLFVWLGVKLLFTTPAIVLERRGPISAAGRSWRLTRGSFWRTFGVMALVVLMYSVASWVVGIPVQLVSVLVVALTGSSGDDASGGAAFAIVYGVMLLVGWLIGAIGLVMISSSTALLYVDARMRREGLDLQLAQAAELRAAGAPHPDPYAAPTT